MADVVLDYHSGGKTLDFLPFACAHYLADEEQQARCVEAVRAFDAPWTLMLREIAPVGMYDTAVELQGKTFVTTELGGGGTSTARSARIARRGARNVLIHAGILKGELERSTSRMLDMPDDDCYHFAEIDGMIEFTVDLGDEIAKDERIARIWPLDRTGLRPQEYRAKRSGIMAARHFPGLIQTGDCLAVLAVAD